MALEIAYVCFGLGGSGCIVAIMCSCGGGWFGGVAGASIWRCIIGGGGFTLNMI